MPSLKDLKIRIASVKSTRKITKAMQMVAAAKLRRAQEAAEAARPYASRMEAVLGNLAAGVAGSPSAPKLLGGTGKDDVHLLVVATSERGLCGGFNSTIVRLARARAMRLLHDGKTVKILTVGKKGREQLRRDLGAHLIGHVDLSDVKKLGYVDAARISHDVLHRFNAGEFDVCTLFFNRFQSVISQVPTERQLIPAVFEARDEAGSLVRIRAERGGDPRRPAAARRVDADLHRPAGERRLGTGRAHVSDGQCHPQRRRDDRQADHRLQPLAPAGDHQRTDRDYFGRGSALEGTENTANGNRSSRQDHPGHRCRRRRAVRGAPARDPQRARNREQRRAAGPRSRAAPGRIHRAHHRDGLDRRPGARRKGHRHRQADPGAGGRRHARAHPERDRRPGR